MSKSDLILSVDIGTTNIKCGVINDRGNVVSFGEKKQLLLRNKDGTAEHDPEKLYSDFIYLVGKVIKGYEDRIQVISLASYQIGFIVLDRNFLPITNILTLLDTRAQETFLELKNKCNFKKIYQNTGCPPFAHYSFSRIFWLRERKKEIFKKARYFLSSKDYILFRLTGEIITEPSVSSATQIMNIHSVSWDRDVLEFLEIDQKQLPQIVSGEKIFKEINLCTKRKLGFKKNVYVVPGLYDGGALIIGMAGFDEKIGIINIGTSAMFRTSCDKVILDKSDMARLQTYYLCSGKWITGAGLNNAGNILEWLKNNFKIPSYSKLFSMAEEIKKYSYSDNLFFLPYLTGERNPQLGSSASGVIYGLREYHKLNNIILSLIEGIGYSLKLIEKTLYENGVKIKEIRIGGSITKSVFWMQILSDILNLPIRTSKNKQSSLVGLGILGFVAIKKYSNLQEAIQKMVKLKDIIKPYFKNVKNYNKKFISFSKLLNILHI